METPQAAPTQRRKDVQMETNRTQQNAGASSQASSQEGHADRPFLTDVKTLRERARQHIERGAVTEGYKADRDTVLRLLNESLATEIVCVLRYKRHYFTATGINAES